jgi:hypothetical protein
MCAFSKSLDVVLPKQEMMLTKERGTVKEARCFLFKTEIEAEEQLSQHPLITVWNRIQGICLALSALKLEPF